MVRRYGTFACLAMACLGMLLMSASPATATRGELPNPEPLWQAFPLNPTGERLVKTEALGAFVPASDRDPGGHVFGATHLVLLCAALVPLVALLRLRVRRSRPSKANDDGSDRLLGFSIIGAVVAGEALYGFSIYTLVVLLL